MNLKNPVVLNSESDTKALCAKIIQSLGPNMIVTLNGDLGTGKTFICREIIKSFCGANIITTSPTFNLVQIYRTSQNFFIYHFDLYRLSYLEEIYELGIEEALDGNLCLIEWPEIVLKILPNPIIDICLKISANNSRICNVTRFY